MSACAASTNAGPQSPHIPTRGGGYRGVLARRRPRLCDGFCKYGRGLQSNVSPLIDSKKTEIAHEEERMTAGMSEKQTEEQNKSGSKAAREMQAQVVTSLQTLLEGEEQILAFTRGVIAGGLKGKLSVGIEALFAPQINVGLTDQRALLQHIHPETGTPSQILPHIYTYGEIASIHFIDIETFGKDPAARLVIKLHDDQYFRVRVSGETNVKGAKTLAEVFSSIVSENPIYRNSPTQSRCPQCQHVLDSLSKFCPYCGNKLTQPEAAVDAHAPAEAAVDAHAPEAETSANIDSPNEPVSAVSNEEPPKADVEDWNDADAHDFSSKEGPIL